MLDPLLHGFDLPLRADYFPLGFPLRIATNYNGVLAAACESWASEVEAFDEAPVRLEIGVAPGGAGELTPPVCRGREHLLTFAAGPELFAVCDLRDAFGFAWLTPAAVENRDYLRWFFLDAMVYSMLCARHLTAVHAGCVACKGRGALLCGASGSGKTTVTYACARAGLTYVGDDAVFLLRRSPDRPVIGKPYQFRFRDDAPELFPELHLKPPKVAQNGKPSIEVRTRDLPGVHCAPRCEIASLVFLERGDGEPARLEPMARDEALDRLVSELPLLEKTAWEEQRLSLERLAEQPAYRLRYSDFRAAVDPIARLLNAC